MSSKINGTGAKHLGNSPGKYKVSIMVYLYNPYNILVMVRALVVRAGKFEMVRKVLYA